MGKKEQREELLEIHSFKVVCPICGSGQFSVLPFPDHMSSSDISPGAIGTSECRDCQRFFQVKIPDELRQVILSAFFFDEELKRIVAKNLFPK